MPSLTVRVLPTKQLVAEGLHDAIIKLDRRNMAPILAETDTPFPEAKRRKAFEIDGTFILALSSTSQIVGYLEICPDWEDPQDLYISSVQIEPQHRRGPVFGRLLGEAVRVLADRPFRNLKTHAQKHNQQALSLYRRLGFAVSPNPASNKSFRLSATRAILQTRLARRLQL